MKAISVVVAVATVLSQLALSGQPLPQQSMQQTVFQPSTDTTRLLAISDTEVVQADAEQLLQRNIRFMDVTDTLDVPGRAEYTRANHRDLPVPKSAQFQPLVRAMIETSSIGRMKQRLTKFTSFKNRYYKSQTGVESAEWLLAQIKQTAAVNGAKVTVSKFAHKWAQFSIIARLEPTQDDVDAGHDDDTPIVIVGAHQDTVRGGFFGDGRAPGADDDGSGTITTLEAFTLLCENKFRPRRPIEFHWYSAEEMGLLGSQDVAKTYQLAEKRVFGMAHFDMTGYGKNGVYGIITDYTDPALTEFLRTLARTYGGIDVVDTQCKYACSDHASWTRSGYRAVMPFEGEFKDSSPYIHTKNDVVANIDFHHMNEFVKLAVSFAVEMGNQ